MPRLMALDVGEVRIGVALSDGSGFLASPYTTLLARSDVSVVGVAVQQLIDETEAEALIIGLPISLDGQIHAQAERIIAFAEQLKTHISLPIEFWDERLSTAEAERLLAESGQSVHMYRQEKGGRRGPHKGKRRKQRNQQGIDALAAAVILQDYLDQHTAPRGTHSGQTEDIL